MNKSKQGKLIGWASIGLSTIGALGTVLMLLAMKTNVPLEEKGPLGQIALAWKGFFGIFPSLFLNAAFLFLGARLFIKGGTSTLYRNLAGCTALAVALSILFGSLSVGAGGWIGAHTGEVVTSRAHIALGALVGLVSVFAAVWFSWLRQSTFGRPAFATKTIPEPVATPKPAPKPLARPVATRLSTPQTAASEEGVTAAESEALFPFEEAPPKPLVIPITEQRAEAPEVVVAPPRSPYPEDLRLKGQIPAGAKPLAPATAPETSAPAAYRWTAPRPLEEEATAAIEPMFDSEAAVRGPRPLRRVEDDDEPAIEDIESHEELPAVAAHDEDEIGALEPTLQAESLVVEEEATTPGMPVPSWEQPALFRPEAGDEEPVDAYGTPLTLVEKLRQARRLAGLEHDDARVVEELAGDAGESVLAEEQLTIGLSAAEVDELMEAPMLDEDDVEDDEEVVEEIVEEKEHELQPVRSRGIPREIDAGYETESAVDEDEIDAANAEDFAADEDELEDDTVVVGIESIDHEAIVLAEADDDELVTAVLADDDSDDDEEGDDGTFDVDEDELVEELSPTAAIEEEELVAVPSFRASAEPVLEPLTLPAVASIARSEPVQPGLFDAPAPVAQPMQTAAAQSKPTMQPAKAPVEAPTSRAEPATAKVDASPKKIDLAPAKPEPVAKKPEPAPSKPASSTKTRAGSSAEKGTSEKSSGEKISAGKSSTEKDVVLQPAAANAAKPAASVKSTSTDTSRPNLLSEIGCLFIERGRVAVSMLQRQYSMDFDAACKVLDDLQEMGLIGPYLGGQRRDILLTRDQWLERVSQAGAAR